VAAIRGAPWNRRFILPIRVNPSRMSPQSSLASGNAARWNRTSPRERDRRSRRSASQWCACCGEHSRTLAAERPGDRLQRFSTTAVAQHLSVDGTVAPPPRWKGRFRPPGVRSQSEHGE
jgi:hypothetical protein